MSLPKDYIDFCIKFGGGYFGLINVFTLTPHSDWYIVQMYKSAEEHLPSNLIPFSDDGTGGLYCFSSTGNNQILYVDEMGVLRDTEYEDFFQFLIENAYSE
ncbi:SMI1/KNR4 family protein [Fibrella sp. HMF5405]|uniref:SMI1/KNR4 family protein n=1 Tax=Fibrella forsythiae TaxID=2817061 RepID=A0ABS3JRN1_9BACT|nr:SMI1/KNR4 family protein [Fibrella forsythiae]